MTMPGIRTHLRRLRQLDDFIYDLLDRRRLARFVLVLVPISCLMLFTLVMLMFSREQYRLTRQMHGNVEVLQAISRAANALQNERLTRFSFEGGLDALEESESLSDASLALLMDVAHENKFNHAPVAPLPGILAEVRKVPETPKGYDQLIDRVLDLSAGLVRSETTYGVGKILAKLTLLSELEEQICRSELALYTRGVYCDYCPTGPVGAAIVPRFLLRARALNAGRIEHATIVGVLDAELGSIEAGLGQLRTEPHGALVASGRESATRAKNYLQSVYAYEVDALAMRADQRIVQARGFVLIAYAGFFAAASALLLILWFAGRLRRDRFRLQKACDLSAAHQARWERLVESIPGAVYRVRIDSGMEALYISEAINDILGFTPEAFLELSGHDNLRRIHRDDREVALACIAAAHEVGEPWEIQYRYRHCDGTYRWLRNHGRVVAEEADGALICEGVIFDHTALHTAQVELAESECRLQLALSCGRVAFWDWELADNRVRVNEFAEDLFGCSAADMAGFGWWKSRIHGEDQAATLTKLRAHVRGATPFFEHEHRIRRGDGSWIWVHSIGQIVQRDEHGAPLRASGVLQNITARKHAELALRESENNLRRAEKLAGMGHWRWARGEETIYCSEATLSILRITEPIDGRIAPQQAMRQFTPASRRTMAVAIRQLGPGRDVCRLQLQLKTSGNTERWCALEMQARCDAAGHVVSAFGVLQDITERVLAEQRERNLEENMRQAQRLESLGLMAGGIAHDFNNILAVIVGNADLADELVKPESAVHTHLERIVTASMRAEELCAQMLTCAGRSTAPHKAVAVGELVTELRSLLDASTAKNIVTRFSLHHVHDVVYGDAAQLRQVFLNILLNASESLGGRAGNIEVSSENVVLDAHDLLGLFGAEEAVPGEYLCMRVTDNGCGMPPQVQARLFEPFFTTKFAGRGLGMSAVLGILRAHGAGIRFSSTPQQGTCFEVLLPCSATEATAMHSDPHDAELVWRGHGRVLVVDDEEALRTVSARLLGNLGFEVDLAEDGLDALNRCGPEARGYALVLLDMNMPHMSGSAVLEELHRRNPQLPVLLCSGYSEDDVTLSAYNPACVGFLKKPYRLGELKLGIRQLLEGGATPAVSAVPASAAAP